MRGTNLAGLPADAFPTEWVNNEHFSALPIQLRPSRIKAGARTYGQEKRALQKPQLWVRLGVLFCLVGFLYFDVLRRLVTQWMNDQNYSHGFFVPAFSLYVLWSERKKFDSLNPSPSWFGLVIVLAALGQLIVGQLGAELFLSRSSLILLLGGVVVFLLGWSYLKLAFFPWIFLIFMVPIPTIIFNQIAFPLQTLASKLATAQLQILGVPVLREGNVIHLPAMALEVVEACSGIRSLMSLFTLAIIYGYFLETRFVRRAALALSAIPIAVIANAWRVTGTGLLGEYWDPDKAQGFFHTFSGWIIFVISLLLLFGIHGLIRVIERWWSGRRGAPSGEATA
jgi:exosortase A